MGYAVGIARVVTAALAVLTVSAEDANYNLDLLGQTLTAIPAGRR